MRLIDADALKENIPETNGKIFNSVLIDCDEVRKMIDEQPTIDLLDQTVYGYSIRFLAYVAAVMAKKGITAEQAAETVTDMRAFVSFFYEEQKEITRKALEEIGKSQKSYTDWELRRE